MKRYIGEFDNGYCGCDVKLYFIADNDEQVDRYMNERLYDYALDYAHCCINCDNDEGEEWESYFEDCNYSITEIEEDCEDYNDVKTWIGLHD